MRRSLALATVVTLLATSVAAQRAPASSVDSRGALYSPAADVTISLLTAGVGSELWQLFGHSALWIHDDRTGRDTVFNWGAFDLQAPNFIPRFLKGLLFYRMAGDSIQRVLLDNLRWNRTVVVQELDLSDVQKESILGAVRLNARPENVVYRYDYFIDNCATKPRDILDRALGGQLRSGSDSSSGSTYRSHVMRLMHGDPLLALGAYVALGGRSDRPLTMWQETFLPQKLHDWIATRQVRDATGNLHALVKGERILVHAHRPPGPAHPPSFAGLWLAGAIVAGVFAWLGVTARTAGAARVGAAAASTIWAIASGLLGITLTLLWTSTDHHFAYANENILLFNPLWLVLAVTLPMTLLRGRTVQVTNYALLAVLALDGLALIAHLTGVSRQANLPIIGLALLPAAGLVFATRQARKT
jgi:hypothetical protein